MKKIVFINLIIFFSITAFGQEIKNYNLDITIDIELKQINVKGTIEIDFEKQDSISLVLWKNSTIHAISSNQVPVQFTFDTTSSSPIIYIPNGGSLTLENPKRSNHVQTIFFNYECEMQEVYGWGKSFTEEWIEIGYYTAWFPVHANSRNFTSKVNISIDEGYKVSGSGLFREMDDYWEMSQPWGTFDNIIIASKNLKSRKMQEDKVCIEAIYADFPEGDADSVISTCKDVSHFYQQLYGKLDSSYLKFVMVPGSGSGGYGRKNFISLRTVQFDLYTRKGIAHEMAHFWWHNANTNTWEDWLNEAFAEYSMLMYLREKIGINIFNRYISEYKKRVEKSPPIWGIDRATPEAYSALYEKGSLILMEFEEKLGQEQFLDFLGLILKEKVANTNEFLDLIEKVLSKDIRLWFENKLKT